MSGRWGQTLVATLVTALVVAFVAAGWMRRQAVPAAVRYLPPQHDLLVATGDLAALWAGVDRHFGEAIRDRERQGALARLAETVREALGESAPVESLDDLAGHGVDVARGALAAVSWSDAGAIDGVLVLPVADATRLRDAFAALQQGDCREASLTSSAGARFVASTWDGESWLAFPEPGLAVIAGSWAQLERSLLHGETNLRWARDSAGVAGMLGSLRGAGARIAARWQRPAEPLVHATALVSFGPAQARLELRVRFERGLLRVADDLLAPRRFGAGHERLLVDDSAAVIALHDPAIARYLRAASRFAPIGTYLERSHGGVLARLRDAAGLERLTLAVTGYRDGLPELLLGLEGDAGELERIVSDTQVELAEARDRELLDAARAAWVATGSATAPSVEALEAAGLLAPEPALRSAPDAARFERPEYRREVGTTTVRYLAPPRNENDWRYASAGADLDRDAFFGDRYRMASARIGDVLWVATDASDIDALLSREASGTPGIDRRPTWQAATRSWAARDKLRFFVDLDRLVELGLLTPEPEVEDAVRIFLLDLREYPAATMALRPVAPDTLQLTARLPTRAGLGAP